MTRIFLIRHAEAEGNIFRRAHGHVNGQIIGRGFKQIEMLRDRLINENISAVYSSDLSRAVTTAAAVSEHRELIINTAEQLREVRMGVWEDAAWGNIKYYEPDMEKLFNSDPARWHIEGGEEYVQVQSRMRDCIEDIAKKHDGESVAVVSHGFAIRSFISLLKGIQSHEIVKVPYFDNTAVALLIYDKGGFSVEYEGDNSHLKGDTSTFAHQTWWRGEKESKRENMRILQLSAPRDRELVELCGGEGYYSSNANKEYTAFIADEPAGIIGLNIADDSIVYIYLKPEYRQMNYGVQLLGQAVTELRSLQREVIRICIPADNPAVKLFLKYGFEGTHGSEKEYLMEKNIRNW